MFEEKEIKKPDSLRLSDGMLNPHQIRSSSNGRPLFWNHQIIRRKKSHSQSATRLH